MKLWYEYEEGKTLAACLVREICNLECMLQAVIYEERTGKDMSALMKLEAKVTRPELQPFLKMILEKYGEIQQRKQADIVVIFVSGTCRFLTTIFTKYFQEGLGSVKARSAPALPTNSVLPISPFAIYFGGKCRTMPLHTKTSSGRAWRDL
jgi:hypothetical protein